MSDPFLSTHQVYPAFFNLGGRLAPISIRDQMVRAQMFVDRACQSGVLNARESLKLVHSCNHLTAFYPLNRFLAILLDAYVRLIEKKDGLLFSNRRVESVDSADQSHICRNSPVTCHGYEHQVELTAAPDCLNNTAGHKLTPERAEVVIIRHGIGAASLPLLPDLPQPRQILPTGVV